MVPCFTVVHTEKNTQIIGNAIKRLLQLHLTTSCRYLHCCLHLIIFEGQCLLTSASPTLSRKLGGFFLFFSSSFFSIQKLRDAPIRTCLASPEEVYFRPYVTSQSEKSAGSLGVSMRV